MARERVAEHDLPAQKGLLLGIETAVEAQYLGPARRHPMQVTHRSHEEATAEQQQEHGEQRHPARPAARAFPLVPLVTAEGHRLFLAWD
jgi:hypothetical protein